MEKVAEEATPVARTVVVAGVEPLAVGDCSPLLAMAEGAVVAQSAVLAVKVEAAAALREAVA